MFVKLYSKFHCGYKTKKKLIDASLKTYVNIYFSYVLMKYHQYLFAKILNIHRHVMT